MSSSQKTKRPADQASSTAAGVPHIRSREDHLYQQSGGNGHYAIEDWLQAEANSTPKKEIKSEKSYRKTE